MQIPTPTTKLNILLNRSRTRNKTLITKLKHNNMIQVEVKEASKDDVLKQGDYAISKDGKELVQVSEYNGGKCFAGQTVLKNAYNPSGTFSATWNATEFRKFYGTITIKCD